jgi:predicted nuclease with TOPRIM domain
LLLQRFAHIEETYQQMMEQHQATQAESRRLASKHGGELRELQAKLDECQAERTRLGDAEALYKKRNEELYKQVCTQWCWCDCRAAAGARL